MENVTRLRKTYRTYQEGECILHGKVENNSGKWSLFYGIHRGTLMSRDTYNAEFTYTSFNECVEVLALAAANLSKLGYWIWFAEAIAPDGTKHKLVDGAPYY
jgi:hypothetical protein